jgi:hypothetical protein
MFTFTHAMRAELEAIQPSVPEELPSRVNDIDEDLEDIPLNHPRSGKACAGFDQSLCGPNTTFQGQNEMMQDWAGACAPHYLLRMLSRETNTNPDDSCTQCQASQGFYSCQDCFHQRLLCDLCLKQEHSNLPTHRFRKWNGSFFEQVASQDIGYIFQLGHNGKSCNLGYNRRFTLGDLNGLHTLTIRFCQHPGSGDAARQLLSAQIFPCSDRSPASGFTFHLLRTFYLLATEAKISGQRYYNVLVRLTSNTSPHTVPDRYREFLRVSRQWNHLQHLKRAGQFKPEAQQVARGDLALRCPACPRKGYNYESTEVEPHNWLACPCVHEIQVNLSLASHLYSMSRMMGAFR